MRTRIALPLCSVLVAAAASVATAQAPAWTKKLGGIYTDYADAAASAGTGVYVAGSADSASIQSRFEAWVYKLDTAGNVLWFRQFGSTQHDYARAAAADGAGGVFVGGNTQGNLAGPSAGSTDA